MLDNFDYEENEKNKFKCSIYDLCANNIQNIISKYKYGLPVSVVNKMKQSNNTIAMQHYLASKVNQCTIAEFIMEKFKFVYKCASIKHNIWYEFKNHRWIEIDNKYSLRNLIDNELANEYGKIQTHNHYPKIKYLILLGIVFVIGWLKYLPKVKCVILLGITFVSDWLNFP